MSPRDTNSAARQALSDQHKEAVKSWVPKVRRVLEEEFAAQLDRLGLKPDGKHMPTEKMRLSEEVIRTRRRVEALLRRDAIAESSTQRGFDNVVRELAYTLLNRLVGLKAMEARALLYLPPPRDPEGTPEQTEVLTPIPGQAYSRYLRDFRLGWVYQFFNREEKKRIREENKGTPRSSYELAVINQFYTPSWVVKALVDNTLGRLWLQMHPDSSVAPKAPPPLPDKRESDDPIADYLVPHTGEKISYQLLSETGEVVTFKRARDIALLDPACGTMHFGQYAFGLFHRMYLDEIEHAGKPGWPEEPSVTDPCDIPAAILENNLFGIDIDPRAIQIASLSLMLTAKEAALRCGFSPLDVRIRRTNLAVANAVNLDPQARRAGRKAQQRRGATGAAVHIDLGELTKRR